jgi:hypothetical protein
MGIEHMTYHMQQTTRINLDSSCRIRDMIPATLPPRCRPTLRSKRWGCR